jgi:DNA-binding beta-propeller fold protein YncE
MSSRLSAGLLALMLMTPGSAQAASALTLEVTIPLPDVAGRIDHLAFDPKRQHLWIAELGNNSVDVVDLASQQVIHRIDGLEEPQGIAYSATSDQVIVASGGDGTVRFYNAETFAEVGNVDLGEDADNVHVDPKSGSVAVAYGNGGLALLDPATHGKLADVALPAHPEGFQIGADHIFVNVPGSGEIAVIDSAAKTVEAHWPVPSGANFPMALDDSAGAVAVVYRDSATLALLSQDAGTEMARLPTCQDADDVFFDAKRARLYVSCGAGEVRVVQWQGGQLADLASIPTEGGTRTSLYVPELERLFVARRAGDGSDAALLVLRPQ